MRLVRQLRRVTGTAALALEMAGRLALLRALEDEPSLTSRAAVLQEISRVLLRLHCIEACEHGSPPEGPALIVSNHVSYLDPLVILARAPALPVAKEEVRAWPVIGRLCERSGVRFVARARAVSGASVLRTMARALLEGASVLNFPEGTTTDGSRVLPLKAACFAAARIARVPVVPVALRWETKELSWTGDASFLPHYLEVAGRSRIFVSLRWGEPLAASSDLETSRRAHEFLSRWIGEMPHAAAERA